LERLQNPFSSAASAQSVVQSYLTSQPEPKRSEL
jgi:hypothetical protein